MCKRNSKEFALYPQHREKQKQKQNKTKIVPNGDMKDAYTKLNLLRLQNIDYDELCLLISEG